jgi:hypothetical protein
MSNFLTKILIFVLFTLHCDSTSHPIRILNGGSEKVEVDKNQTSLQEQEVNKNTQDPINKDEQVVDLSQNQENVERETSETSIDQSNANAEQNGQVSVKIQENPSQVVDDKASQTQNENEYVNLLAYTFGLFIVSLF